jgi:tryptophan-rich sensory protein
MTAAALTIARRARRRDAFLSALIPLLAVVFGNGLIFATGFEGGDEAFESLALAPPPWFVAAMWVVIFPMWGLARWHVARHGRRGKRESLWVVALILWALAYPLLTSFETTPSAWANLASLVLAAITCWRAAIVSKKAAWLIAPSILWIGFATVLGFVALAKVQP